MAWIVAGMLLWLTMEFVTKITLIWPVILMAMTVPIVIQVILISTVAVAQGLVCLDKAIVGMMLNVQMILSVEVIIVDLASHGVLIVVRSKTLIQPILLTLVQILLYQAMVSAIQRTTMPFATMMMVTAAQIKI